MFERFVIVFIALCGLVLVGLIVVLLLAAFGIITLSHGDSSDPVLICTTIGHFFSCNYY